MLSLRQVACLSARQWRRIPAISSVRCRSQMAAATSAEPLFQPANPLQVPQPDGPDKPLSPKLEQLVASITSLTLFEVAELSKALKKRLNLPDTPMMPMGGMAFAAAPQPQAEDEEDAVKAVKTNFTLKLVKFDEKQKVALIKEVKNVMEGMNLVQAKKFVESVPAIVRADVAKDEAEKLKEVLEKVGAICELE